RSCTRRRWARNGRSRWQAGAICSGSDRRRRRPRRRCRRPSRRRRHRRRLSAPRCRRSRSDTSGSSTEGAGSRKSPRSSTMRVVRSTVWRAGIATAGIISGEWAPSPWKSRTSTAPAGGRFVKAEGRREHPVTRRLTALGILLALALAGASCAAVNAFRKGETAMRAGDLDQAVAYYRAAVQAAPDNANYRIALERAMQAASRAHMERAREFEQKDQLEAALGDYRLATEYEPSNRLAVPKVAAPERTIR